MNRDESIHRFIQIFYGTILFKGKTPFLIRGFSRTHYGLF